MGEIKEELEKHRKKDVSVLITEISGKAMSLGLELEGKGQKGIQKTLEEAKEIHLAASSLMHSLNYLKE